MEKFWFVTTSPSNKHASYAEAEESAKRKLGAGSGYEKAWILEVVALAKSPVPAVEVVKIT